MNKVEYENFDYSGATLEDVENKVDYELEHGIESGE